MSGGVTVVIAGRGRYQTLIRTIVSLQKSDVHPERIIYADTGSASQVTEDIRREFPDVQIVSMEGGNPQAGRNAGASLAKTKYVLFADDDVEFGTSCISQAFSLMEHVPMVGLVGWNTDCPASQPDCIGYTTMSPVWLSRNGQSKSWRGARRVYTVRNAYLVRTDLFWKIGGWDEDLYIQFDENDLCFRIYLAGYSVACIGDSPITDINWANRNNSAYIEEVGTDRYALSVRNMVLVAVKTLSLPSLVTIFPLAVFVTIVKSLVDRNLRSAIHGLSLSASVVGKFWKKRGGILRGGWQDDMKIISSLLRESEIETR